MHIAEFMAYHGLRDEDLAAAIKRHRVSVSRYRRGLIRPDWDTIEAIRVYTKGKVAADDWRILELA